MTKVRRSWLVALAGAMALVSLAVPLAAQAAFPGANGKIAFERDNEIFLMNPDGSGAAPLTSNGVAKRDPAVSPDGKRIAFLRADVGDIFAMNLDGTGLVNLTNDPEGQETDVAWSPDGTKI